VEVTPRRRSRKVLFEVEAVAQGEARVQPVFGKDTNTIGMATDAIAGFEKTLVTPNSSLVVV